LEGIRIENAGILNAHLEYIMAIWYIFWSFGDFVVIYYIFPYFGIMCHEKSGIPDPLDSPKRFSCPEAKFEVGFAGKREGIKILNLNSNGAAESPLPPPPDPTPSHVGDAAVSRLRFFENS
jgi:hypothetical protein